MSHKKEIESQLSLEENSQIQDLLARYQQIAEGLQDSTTPDQVNSALATINTAPETVQMALLKALGRTNESAAADVLVAVNVFSPQKELRKEARRALIRLEGAKIHPQWTPPVVNPSAIQVPIANPPRFLKGVATQSREEGEIQLVLCWEQGYDYSETRMLIFLLDFWEYGVKDLIVETANKRRVDEQLRSMRTKLADTTIVDCTLAEGKRLLEEALSVNEWRGTPPGENYRAQIPLVNRLILQTSELSEDRGQTLITPDMEDQEVIINFLGGWAMGDYGLSYDLLTQKSDVRNNMTRDEWAALHRAWSQEAHPARMELGFVHEIPNTQSAIWLPNSALGNRSASRKEIEIGWSLELADTPLSGTLKEMPMGTAVNKETGRHWFWTRAILVREQGAWRIQQIFDEGTRSQGLPIAELQSRIKELEHTIEELFENREKNIQEFLEETAWRLANMLHYYDALLTQLSLDQEIHEEAYGASILAGNPERTMVYLERIAQRFPQGRAKALHRLGSTLVGLAYQYIDAPGLQERQKHLLGRAEEVLREALNIENSATGHLLLGELLMNMQRNDEATAELRQAREMQPDSDNEAAIEAGLGNLAMRQERIAESIPHFQRVAQLNPAYPGVQFSLGFAQRMLGNYTEAEGYYQQALQDEPTDIRPYIELTAIYMNRSEPDTARALMEKGVNINPESAQLQALLASVLIEMGDHHAAQRHLAEAERLDPDLEVVKSVRQHIQSSSRKK